MQIRSVIPALVLATVLAVPAAHAAKHTSPKAAATPPPATAAPGTDSLAPAPTPPAPSLVTTPKSPILTVAPKGAVVLGTSPGVARTPGVLVRPGSPIVDRTTIVPFPAPGETSRAAIAHAKLMNVPRVGETLLESTRAGGWKVRDSVLYWDPGDVTGPQKVDVFPEQRTETAPVYPDSARDAGIQGTVVVMALVLVDGTVTETRVVKSIPALDGAAVDAVKRLRFKPGTAQGKPVTVWVAVPVRFKLN